MKCNLERFIIYTMQKKTLWKLGMSKWCNDYLNRSLEGIANVLLGEFPHFLKHLIFPIGGKNKMIIFNSEQPLWGCSSRRECLLYTILYYKRSQVSQSYRYEHIPKVSSLPPSMIGSRPSVLARQPSRGQLTLDDIHFSLFELIVAHFLHCESLEHLSRGQLT